MGLWPLQPPAVLTFTVTQNLLLISHFHKFTRTLKAEDMNNANQLKKMCKPILLPIATLYLSLLFLHTHFTVCSGDTVLGLSSLENSAIDAIVRRDCTKQIGDCFEEPEMESEISRRVLLMGKKYISYETLKRDMVPCAKPGASYYDCNAGEAHPYSRGCEVITRCARDVKDIKT